METQGRKELTELVLGCVALANAGVQVAADGKVGLEDLGSLMAALPRVVTAVEGVDKVPAEVLDLSSEEGVALVADVALSLSLGDEKAKKIVLASLELLVGVKHLVVAILEQPAPAVVAEAPASEPAAPVA